MFSAARAMVSINAKEAPKNACIRLIRANKSKRGLFSVAAAENVILHVLNEQVLVLDQVL